MNLDNVQKIHFIGIGGIGLSAIARMMLVEGKMVTGSELSPGLVTDVLIDAGATIYEGHREDNVTEDVDLVIYTIAVPDDNPELKRAKELNIPLLTYPEALGAISKDKYTIAVAGTHGKTTTTGMIAQIMLEAGKDPSVIIGSFLKGYKSNFISGKSKYFVSESCEYKRSFLHMHPNILVITNIEEEHLDYYNDLEDIQDAFRSIVKKIPEDGYLVCNPKDPNVFPVLESAFCNIIDYTMEKIFFDLKIPGEHNVENARAAIAVTYLLDVPRKNITESLERFAGTWRRSDHLGETKKGAIVYDDYAHHPDEVTTTIKGFKDRFKKKKLIVVFQPHLYSRTKIFFKDFVESLLFADELIILPIYAARETPDESINSEMLVDAIAKKSGKVLFMSDFYEIERHLNKEYGKDDIITTMGAGDVYKIGENITQWQKST